MGFKCGIVGLPNVGKSTLFNALTKAGIAAQNYPFCTIEPNVGVVAMPDLRLDAIAAIVKPQKVIPTSMEFVDIAGLVAGAAKGEGLGNQFLAHIRETEAIAQVVRCFENDDIIHVTGKIDPLSDIETIQTELALADLDSVARIKQRVERRAKGSDKEAIAECALADKCLRLLNDGLHVRGLTSLTDAENILLRSWNLLTAKPVLYVANVSEEGFTNNPYLEKVEAFAKKENAPVVVICASLEAEMIDLSDAEKIEMLSAYDQSEPGLNRLIRAGYDLLELQTYFTAGEKEVRAWTFEKGSTAPIAAGKIHTDFTKGFIRAEVIAYDDFITYKGEQGTKEAGKWRLEGKEYIVKDGDIMHFRFNV